MHSFIGSAAMDPEIGAQFRRSVDRVFLQGVRWKRWAHRSGWLFVDLDAPRVMTRGGFSH
jgi:hypothetical protein